MSVDAPAGPAIDAPDEPATGVVEQVRPSARCHACSDGVVVAVCSGCARLLCPVHDLAAGPLGPRAVLRLFRADPEDDAVTMPEAAGKMGRPPGRKARGDAAAQPAGKPAASSNSKAADGGSKSPVGRAATGGSDKKPKPAAENDGRRTDRRPRQRPRGAAQRHYCADCVPRARPYDAELVAATTTGGLGVVVLPVQAVAGAVLVGLAAVRVGVRTALDLRRRSRTSTEHGAAPLLNPNLRKVKARERIRGTVRLDDDRKYEATVEEVVGSVRIEGNWSRWHRAELIRYRRRTKTEPATAAAGHVVLHGPARVAFRPAPDAAVNGGPALVLEPRVAEQAVLHSADGRGDTRWRPEFHYDISPPDHGWTLPVLVTPNIAADRERHVLELWVQWNTRKPERPHTGVPLRTIEVLEIDVPAHWGTVEFMTPLGDERRIGQPVERQDGVGRRTLTWRKVRYTKGGDRKRERFAVRFSDAIDLDHELTGRIEARFEGAVSGVTRIGLYRTDGAQVKGVDGARQPQTIVDVTFGLCLKGLRYQQQRVVPDRSRAEDVHRQETHRFPGVPPDHRTVALLTNTLADEGYYVIRVLENPAQPSPRSGAVNRLWDLLGRYYEGVYPIEFHLVLSGEEIRKGQDVTGDTSVLLIVSGSYANEEMEQRVIEEWTRLWKRIRLSLRAAGGEPRSLAQPLDSPSSELARLRNVMVTETARLSAAADAGRMDRDLSSEVVARLTREFGLSGE